MHCLKKIITAYSLLLLLATPLVFSMVVLVKQQIIQHERDEKFKKKNLQTITVSATAVYWVKPEKEILVAGKLFDVKYYTKNDDCIFLTGFFDDKEDRLVQQIVKLALQKSQSGKPGNQPAIMFLFFPAYAIDTEVMAGSPGWKYISQPYPRYDERIPLPPACLPVHPPC